MPWVQYTSWSSGTGGSGAQRTVTVKLKFCTVLLDSSSCENEFSITECVNMPCFESINSATRTSRLRRSSRWRSLESHAFDRKTLVYELFLDAGEFSRLSKCVIQLKDSRKDSSKEFSIHTALRIDFSSSLQHREGLTVRAGQWLFSLQDWTVRRPVGTR